MNDKISIKKEKNVNAVLINDLSHYYGSGENRKMVLDYNYNAINNLKISGNPLKFSFMNINDNVKKSPDLNENKSEILKKIK